MEFDFETLLNNEKSEHRCESGREINVAEETNSLNAEREEPSPATRWEIFAKTREITTRCWWFKTFSDVRPVKGEDHF